jgi:hypothetical protein
MILVSTLHGSHLVIIDLYSRSALKDFSETAMSKALLFGM